MSKGKQQRNEPERFIAATSKWSFGNNCIIQRNVAVPEQLYRLLKGKILAAQERSYSKQQKLCKRKVSRFIGFYSNVGETFAVLLYSQSICRENFHNSLKIRKNCNTFYLRSFCCLQYVGLTVQCLRQEGYQSRPN